jgi:ATP-binding cassette subfamily C protein
VYGHPALIVLDEPNASLDAAGEEALLRAMQRLKALRRTVVIISHKMNILTEVDKILVMADGVVQSFGPRDAILHKLIAQPVPTQQQQPQPQPQPPQPANNLAKAAGRPYP